MKRYLRLLTIFYKSTLANEMEYRLNFWSNVGISLFWLTWAALSVRVYFFHAETIGGWSYNEVLIVMGLFFAMNGFRQLLLVPNLSRLSEYVQFGTLDFILTKPVNSQFMISLRYIGVFNWTDPLLGLGLVIYGLWRLQHVPSLWELLGFGVLCCAAMLLLYSLSLMLQTLTIWLTNVDRLDALIEGAMEAGRFPVNFYRGWVSTALTVVVPVAFLTTFPAEALLGRIDPALIGVAVVVALVMFAVASWFWPFALRYYTGASA